VTFTGLADHRMFVKFSASTITGGVGMLLDSNGAPMTAVSVSKLDTFIDSVPLPSTPASGTYTVVVDPSGTKQRHDHRHGVRPRGRGSGAGRHREPAGQPDGDDVVARRERRHHLPGRWPATRSRSR
jgi:hypothetical protein